MQIWIQGFQEIDQIALENAATDSKIDKRQPYVGVWSSM